MYPQAYLDYLIYFHAHRDYFECHEVLEAYWKEEAQRKKIWVGLIQIAVALYHQRRGNFAGAKKMMHRALEILEKEQNELERLGIHSQQLLKQLAGRLQDIEQERAYQSMTLPLKHDLLQTCQQLCQEKRLTWGKVSDLNNEFLIHKHTLRDRSEVIAERKMQQELRTKEI